MHSSLIRVSLGTVGQSVLILTLDASENNHLKERASMKMESSCQKTVNPAAVEAQDLSATLRGQAGRVGTVSAACTIELRMSVFNTGIRSTKESHRFRDGSLVRRTT
jgi:hypothetical protein